MTLPAVGKEARRSLPVPLRAPNIPELRDLVQEDGQVDNSQLCPGDMPQLQEEPGADPAYRITRTGIVAKGREGKKLLFQFDLGSESAESQPREGYVRVELVKPQAPPQLACGSVKSGITYRLPDALAAGDEDKLVIRLYDRPLDDNEEKRFETLRGEREKELFTADLLQRERGALRKEAELQEITGAAERLADIPQAPTSMPLLEEALQKTRATLARLKGCPQNDEETKVAPPLFRALCTEATSIDTSVQDVARRLTRYQAAMGSREFQSQRAALLEDLLQAARHLDAGSLPSPEERDVHCESVSVLSWLRQDSAFRLVAQVELPAVSPDRVVHVRYGTGDSRATLPSGESLAVLLGEVPTGVQLGTFTRQNELQRQQSPAQAFADFLTVVLPLLSHAPWATVAPRFEVAPPSPPESRKPLVEPWWPTLLCQEPDFKVDTKAAPIALVGTRSVSLGKLKAEYETELYVCDKSPCEAKAGNDQLRNKVVLEPKQGTSFPVLVELAGTVSTSRGLSFGSPKYEPIDGPTGPQRLYELRSSYEAQKAFSVSLLFGYQFHERLAVALGPSVLVGASGGIFSQLNLRAGILMSRGAYLTVGPSLRFVKSATSETPLGSRITVENRDDAKVPEPRAEYHPRLGLSLGVSMDVSTLADAGKGLLKTVGVSP